MDASLSRPHRRAALMAGAGLAAAPQAALAAVRVREGRGPDPRLAERIARIEADLTPFVPLAEAGARSSAPAAAQTLASRMATWKTPGASYAVIDADRIAFARAHGVADKAAGRRVGLETLFQAGSISKPVAAVAALRLVAAGRLSLDADLRARLRGWGVGDEGVGADEKVTLRRLLSHSAGLNLHGFLGYAPGTALPGLVEILSGADRSNSARVRIVNPPGRWFSYSGGGYVAMQRLVEEELGMGFSEAARRLVLEPAGMALSAYAQPLPAAAMRRAAMAYDEAGAPHPFGPLVLPELTAAGLWTTPSDICRFGLAMARAWRGERGALLPATLARETFTPQEGGWGLGFQLVGEGDALRFGHGGANMGYRNDFFVFPARGQGVAVMTNGDAGSPLAFEIEAAVGRAYGWPSAAPHRLPTPPEPDLKPGPAPDPSMLKDYVGAFRLPGGPQVRVRLQEAGLVIEAATGSWLPPVMPLVFVAKDRFLTAESPTRNVPVDFERAKDGTVRKVVLFDTLQAFRTGPG